MLDLVIYAVELSALSTPNSDEYSVSAWWSLDSPRIFLYLFPRDTRIAQRGPIAAPLHEVVHGLEASAIRLKGGRILMDWSVVSLPYPMIYITVPTAPYDLPYILIDWTLPYLPYCYDRLSPVSTRRDPRSHHPFWDRRGSDRREAPGVSSNWKGKGTVGTNSIEYCSRIL